MGLTAERSWPFIRHFLALYCVYDVLVNSISIFLFLVLQRILQDHTIMAMIIIVIKRNDDVVIIIIIIVIVVHTKC